MGGNWYVLALLLLCLSSVSAFVPTPMRAVFKVFKAPVHAPPRCRRSVFRPSDGCGTRVASALEERGYEVSDALKRFHEALPRAERNGKVLTFADNTTMLGREDLRSDLFCRDCYDDMWGIIQTEVRDKIARSFLVTGTSGVGTSIFAFVLLVELRKQGKTVFYQAEDYGWFCFSDEGVEEGGLDEFGSFTKKGYLRDPDVWFLCDPTEGDNACAGFFGITVAFMSPGPERLKALEKRNKHRTLYMPPWTLGELLECGELLFSNVSPDEIREAHRIGGGIVRNIFHPRKRANLERVLTSAVRVVSKEWLSKVALRGKTMGLYADAPGGGNKLIVGNPREDYLWYTLGFVSELVEELALI